MSLFYRASRKGLELLFRLFYRHEVILPDDLHACKGAIIAANHASFLDPPLIAASWPEPIHFLARKGLFENPILRPIIVSLNAHPLTGKHDINSLKIACKLLQEGKKVLVFPEGTRTQNGKIHHFKNGIALLAKRSGCPVIPAYIHGSFELWPKGKRFPSLWGHRTACVFGAPIEYEEGDHFSQRVQHAVEELKENYRPRRELNARPVA